MAETVYYCLTYKLNVHDVMAKLEDGQTINIVGDYNERTLFYLDYRSSLWRISRLKKNMYERDKKALHLKFEAERPYAALWLLEKLTTDPIKNPVMPPQVIVHVSQDKVLRQLAEDFNMQRVLSLDELF